MSAMPAFGGTHDSATLWNITAFVEQLPRMSAQTYAAIPAEEGAHHGEAEHHHEGQPGHTH